MQNSNDGWTERRGENRHTGPYLKKKKKTPRDLGAQVENTGLRGMGKCKVVTEESDGRMLEFKNKNHPASGKPVDLEIGLGVGFWWVLRWASSWGSMRAVELQRRGQM